MAYGFKDNILRVNLTTGAITVEHPGEAFYKKVLGGKTLAAWYLNKEVSGKCDPLGPENKVIIAASVITGSPIPGSSRHTVAAKSPLTEGFGNSEGGGFFGPELKWAGYDAIIIEGKAEKPCYLKVTNEEVKICDATHLWGKDTGPVQDTIREEMGDKRAKILQTGPGGENMIRFAGLLNELKHWNGRCGMGAVFGSKNLRAVAVRGNDRDMFKELDKMREYAKWFGKSMKDHAGLPGFGEGGTMVLPAILSSMGILPTKNFQQNSFDQVDEIDGVKINEIKVKREGCYACPVNCKQVVENKSDDPDKNIDAAYGAPEYETLGSIGSNCGIADMITVCKGNELVARYGLDSVGTGMTIAFAMECYERGIITKEDTDGLELNFGNNEAFLRIIEKIVKREGIGDILAEGSYRAAEKFGKEAMKYAVTSKKMEFAAHDGRGKWNVGLGYAVSPNGADHVVVEHDHCFIGEPNLDPDALVDGDIFPLMKWGIRSTIDPIGLDHDKVRLFVLLQRLWSVYDTLDICIFVGEPSRRMITFEHITQLVNNATGWDMSMFEIIRVAERGIAMARLFNNKCGIGVKDEVLPDRMFEPITNGPLEGIKMDKEQFLEAREIYYHMTGMDDDGKPLYGKIVELELEELWEK